MTSQGRGTRSAARRPDLEPITRAFEGVHLSPDGLLGPEGRAGYEELQAIVELAPIGIGIVDLEGHTVLTNDALRRMLGYSVEEFARLHWSSFTHADDVARNLELFAEMTSGRTDHFEMDKRFISVDGDTVWARLTVSLLRDEGGAPALAIGMTENITERRQLEDQLREAEATFRLLVEESPGVVYVAQLDLTQPWRYVSPRLEKLLGVTAEEWLSAPHLWWDLMDDRDRGAIEVRIAELISTVAPGPHVLHYRMHRRDGEVRWIRDEFRLVEDPDGAIVFRGVFLDVTREKELEEGLERQATHDPLTGLANRDLFSRRIAELLDAPRRGPTEQHHAVLLVDLDDFKTVNDSLGHAAGDELIRSVAERIGACLRPGDLAGRLGGDEFGLLIEGLADPVAAVVVAARIQEAIGVPHHLTGKTVATSASLGIAYLEDAASVEVVLRNADLAMYRAKHLGKGRVAAYEPALHDAAVRRLDIRSSLEGALERDELQLFLQPIVDLETVRIVAAEALLRWVHPVHGQVPPDDFIPIAEETGVIGPIGEWVLDEACRWLAEQHAGGWTDLSVEVNVSPVQLDEDGFVETVEEVLRASGLPPCSLVLEITEQALMSPRSWFELEKLDRLGVRIAIDDFGTGYASLAYLSGLAIDVLKIDRQFIAQLGGEVRGRAVPEAIVHLAGSLELETIAEGIETVGQWEELRSLGCRLGQGYLFARPMPAVEVAALLGDRLAALPTSLASSDG
ncbi:putative bifunctional diguanylate cyclase/phosphodiesterase [Nitriliruptor alkaliphilus]|uniref:putative bifunctional diguanylate cyclase/phosphodiesterase n=1 Tax=Nitriliruptor alkaliphilus TaxID=427918 RepID=UPI000696785F|nr:GGDEF domain-containing phosphodiesterase [Nitriliruptor alkaliphilus]